MRAEIRCCCDPGKLLGWVELRQEQIREGDVLSFILRPVVSVLSLGSAADAPVSAPERLTLPVAFWQGDIYDIGVGEYAWKREMGLALKSNDTPIETLRRIPSFQEAP